MGRSWHKRNRNELEAPSPAAEQLLAIIMPHLNALSEDARRSAMKNTRRVMRKHRKKRGADRAMLRRLLS